ncbi:hypothetical protein, partial [Allosphingosinicella sp.]|uniref:hypothetical protein n=1 Tax=Allosphingosinicella sp. TaxID=2823234 RepID=UPI002F016FBF
AALATLFASAAGYALDSKAAVPPAQLTYADSADLALSAPVAAHVRVVRASALRQRDVPDSPPGHRRFLVEADLVSLIRGPGALPARVRYLVDLPNDERGRAAKIPRRTEYLLLASPVPGRPGELRLAARDSQLPFTPALAERFRRILAESSAAAAPPRITAVGRAFHVPGSIPGESETQIFLQTADQRPVSLSILRRPGESPRWAVALSEFVDESASTPARDSLLWYRLACFLPRTLPSQSIGQASRSDTAAIQADYQLVLDSLGPCSRNRVRN